MYLIHTYRLCRAGQTTQTHRRRSTHTQEPYGQQHVPNGKRMRAHAQRVFKDGVLSSASGFSAEVSVSSVLPFLFIFTYGIKTATIP